MNVPSKPGVAGDVNAPAQATAAVITYAADPLRRHCIGALYWSYSAAPTGGSIKVEDVSGTVVFGPLAITAAGPGYIPIDPPLCNNVVNTALIVTLASGAGSVVGVVGARHWLE